VDTGAVVAVMLREEGEVVAVVALEQAEVAAATLAVQPSPTAASRQEVEIPTTLVGEAVAHSPFPAALFFLGVRWEAASEPMCQGLEPLAAVILTLLGAPVAREWLASHSLSDFGLFTGLATDILMNMEQIPQWLHSDLAEIKFSFNSLPTSQYRRGTPQ
jgi:hypothetical protein